jgi:hypothetical protein
MTPTGMTQASLQGTVGRQNEKPLTVCVKSTRGVNPWDGQNLGKGAPAAVRLWSELAEDPVGLVEQDGRQDAPSRRGDWPLE